MQANLGRAVLEASMVPCYAMSCSSHAREEGVDDKYLRQVRRDIQQLRRVFLEGTREGGGGGQTDCIVIEEAFILRL